MIRGLPGRIKPRDNQAMEEPKPMTLVDWIPWLLLMGVVVGIAAAARSCRG